MENILNIYNYTCQSFLHKVKKKNKIFNWLFRCDEAMEDWTDSPACYTWETKNVTEQDNAIGIEE